MAWTDDGFNRLINLISLSKDTRFISAAQLALSSTNDPTKVKIITDMFGNDIKWQNVWTVVSGLASNPITRASILDYLLKNADYFVKNSSFLTSAYFFDHIYACASTNEELIRIDQAFDDKITPDQKIVCQRSRKSSFARIKASQQI